MKANKLRFVLQIINGTIKLIIPTIIFLIYSIEKPEIKKYFVSWIVSNLDPRRNNIADESVWITFQSKEWLENFLRSNMAIFEYGSGGSTIFFSRRVKEVVSIEHNKTWYQRLSNILKEKNVKNCMQLLIEPEYRAYDDNMSYSDPERFTSKECPNMDFRSYVSKIESYPDETFDLIYIDGRSRPSCILAARKKTKKGGVIMLDNSERSHYEQSKKLLLNWETEVFFGPGPYGRYFWETSIWKKPLL